jgi:threonine/homoserine efflux transporter RhtA
VTESILPYIREVLTLSKIPKRSFVILKRSGET